LPLNLIQILLWYRSVYLSFVGAFDFNHCTNVAYTIR
jgi:hypothetical protein